MPMLTPRDVHLDVPLTNLTLAYMQDESNFIAPQVFPIVDVQKQSDKYYIHQRENFNRSGNRRPLAPGTEVEEIGMAYSNDSYFADVYGLSMSFDEQMLANEDTQLQVREMGARQVLTNLMVDREKDFVSNFFVDNVWGTNWDGVVTGSEGATAVVNWDDYTNATPIVDVRRLARTIQLKSGGFKPNTMVISKEVRDVLLDHPDILARLNGGATISNTALITEAKLAEIFEVERLFVMDAIENTAAEGVAESNAFIGGNHVLLCYTPSSAGLAVPAAGLTFAWNAIPGASGLGLTVESFTGDFLRIKQIAEKIQVKMAYDMKIVGADLGGFINSVLA